MTYWKKASFTDMTIGTIFLVCLVAFAIIYVIYRVATYASSLG